MIKQLAAGTAAIALLGFSAANATAVYDADATTTLTITSMTNQTDVEAGTDALFVDALAALFDDDETVTGMATAEATFSGDPTGLVTSLTGPSSVVNTGGATGQATDGSSEAFSFTEGDITMTNTSLTDVFEVSFELSYEIFASAGVDDLAAGEAAEAEAFVRAQGTASFLGDLVGEDGDILNTFVTASADGELTASDLGVITFSVILNPGDTFEMFMFADALGSATGMIGDVNPIPLPGAFGFMAFGIAGAVAAKRRKAA